MASLAFPCEFYETDNQDALMAFFGLFSSDMYTEFINIRMWNDGLCRVAGDSITSIYMEECEKNPLFPNTYGDALNALMGKTQGLDHAMVEALQFDWMYGRLGCISPGWLARFDDQKEDKKTLTDLWWFFRHANSDLLRIQKNDENPQTKAMYLARAEQIFEEKFSNGQGVFMDFYLAFIDGTSNGSGFYTYLTMEIWNQRRGQ